MFFFLLGGKPYVWFTERNLWWCWTFTLNNLYRMARKSFTMIIILDAMKIAIKYYIALACGCGTLKLGLGHLSFVNKLSLLFLFFSFFFFIFFYFLFLTLYGRYEKHYPFPGKLSRFCLSKAVKGTQPHEHIPPIYNII